MLAPRHQRCKHAKVGGGISLDPCLVLSESDSKLYTKFLRFKYIGALFWSTLPCLHYYLISYGLTTSIEQYDCGDKANHYVDVSLNKWIQGGTLSS